jgi:spermidine export protein MdtJ
MALRPWFFLLAAVAAEIVGVTAMKLDAQHGSWGALLFMYAMVGLSFFLLATAMEQIPMAVSYATWETLGLGAVAFIGYRFFGESLGPMKLLGLAVLIAGVVLVNTGGRAAQE